MKSNENQNIEYKEIWKDEYLKWVCGFANADGGTIYIGIDNNGKIVGVKNPQKLIQDLPNKISNILGIVVDIKLLVEKEKYYISILIESYSNPISFKGHFYFRTGSTVQELNGPALEKFLLKKIGKKWDGITDNRFSIDDLSEEAFNIFKNKSKRSERIPEDDLNESNRKLLSLLDLIENNELKRAAIIAFGKNPEKLITGAYVKIGFFRTHTELLFQDEIHGSLFEQVEKTMDLLLTKYMKANISYEGITRVETFDYPKEAIREALLNSLIHKDYSSSNPIQISVYGNWLMIYNDGRLPENWTIDTLRDKHTSLPANPDIARVFFRAGYIEVWGRGTLNIVENCIKAGLPEPVYDDRWGGLAIIFETEKGNCNLSFNENDKLPKGGDLKSSQREVQKSSKKILELIESNPHITIIEISGKVNLSKRGVEWNIDKLKESGIIKRSGSKKDGFWKIRK